MKTTKVASELRSRLRIQQDSFLTPAELTIFLWIYNEASNSCWKEFPASISDVESGTLVKRRRQEKVIGKFTGLGWLKVDKLKDKHDVPYRSFFADMKKLADEQVLAKMFKPDTETYTGLLTLFQGISEVL